MKKTTEDLNSPERYDIIRNTVLKKPALKSLYLEVYHKYKQCIDLCPIDGHIIEIGSGAGFAKDVISNIVTSDVVPYVGIDKVMNATRLDFPDRSLSCICMYNVLHHIPDTPAFFREAARCLKKGGRLLMIEPYPGLLSKFIYRYLHHEDFDPQVKNWEFNSKGPVSDANNALPYVIFKRDVKKFRRLFPDLEITRLEPHTPLRYWLAGGLKKWSLLPSWSFEFASWIDKKLIQISPAFGSFFDIELIKT